jgi:4-methylaminobutanoate oxidase (formaldehyde-forming)
LEVGLNFFVDYEKSGGFIGKEALLKQKEEGVKSLFVQFLLEDPEPLLYGSEPIFRDGEFVGDLGAGSYGHTLGGAVGLGNVENEDGVNANFIKSGSYEILVASKRYKARASLRPMYDPKGERVRS